MFASQASSDHGLFAYLTHSLWNDLFVPFAERLRFLQSLEGAINKKRDCKLVYRMLETETSRLAFVIKSAGDIYGMIAAKEERFGNCITQKYHQV